MSADTVTLTRVDGKYIALMVDIENMGKEKETVSALLMVDDGTQLLGHELEVWDGPRETWAVFQEKWQKLGVLLGLEVQVWRPEWWAVTGQRVVLTEEGRRDEAANHECAA